MHPGRFLPVCCRITREHRKFAHLGVLCVPTVPSGVGLVRVTFGLGLFCGHIGAWAPQYMDAPVRTTHPILHVA